MKMVLVQFVCHVQTHNEPKWLEYTLFGTSDIIGDNTCLQDYMSDLTYIVWGVVHNLSHTLPSVYYQGTE